MRGANEDNINVIDTLLESLLISGEPIVMISSSIHLEGTVTEYTNEMLIMEVKGDTGIDFEIGTSKISTWVISRSDIKALRISTSNEEVERLNSIFYSSNI